MVRRTIALFIPSLGVGGAERQALQLAQNLDEGRWRVLLLTHGHEQAGADTTGNVTHIPLGRRKGILLVARLAAILAREEVQIVQAFLPGAQVYAIPAKFLVRNVKLVAAVRASMGVNQIAGWKGKLSHAIVFGFRGLVDRYVFNSSAGERALGGRLPPGRRRVIFNGIDTARFLPDPAARAYLREVLGAPQNSAIVGIVANVNGDKGYETFVRAAGIVARDMPNVFFVAVGDYRNDLGRRIEALVAELSLAPRFRFLGARTDVERIIPGMDLVCSASSSEGFSNAIAEAMACGVPCVVTAVGDSAFIVGETGIVVQPHDSAALASGLRSLLLARPDDLRRRGRSARQRIEEHFGIRQMVEQYESLYESLLARPGKRSDGASVNG